MSILHTSLLKLADGINIDSGAAEAVFEIVMSGKATDAQIGALLMGLRQCGETPAIVTAAAKVMRAKAKPITAPQGAIDIVGTGGDNLGTYNISTATAIVSAACGVPVAKHGNKAFSSLSGVADILGVAGINLDAPFASIERSIRECNFGFLLAPRHHLAMRHVGPARVELGLRTIFNILGPLANPANVKKLLVGCYDPRWLVPMAQTLGALGADHAWVVHGHSNMDEISTTGPTQVACWHDGKLSQLTIYPEDAGLPVAKLDDLIGGTPQDNLQALHSLLAGDASAYRDIVLLNTAAAMIIAGKCEDLRTGVGLAMEAIDSGAAKQTLDAAIAISQAPTP